MVALTDKQKITASKVLTYDEFGMHQYKPSDIISVEIKEDFFHFKVTGGMHPIHRETFNQYKVNFPELEEKPVEQPRQMVSNDEYYGDLVDLIPTKQVTVTAIADEPNEVIPVASSSGNAVYLVAPQQQTCTCKGFQYRVQCKHLNQINLEALTKIASDYGYEVSELNKSFSIYQYKYGKRDVVLHINFDKNNNCYWYRPNQAFGNPVNAFETWAKANYKTPKASKRIRLAS